jgi:FMN phosphatase YigB (HAD superfamily)
MLENNIIAQNLRAKSGQLLNAIISDSCEIVSLDIFDTVISRPFLSPQDLFCLLNDYFVTVSGASSFIKFDELRIEAEKACRKRLAENIPGAPEEVTLDGIYEYLADGFGMDTSVLEKVKKREIELEIRFCAERKYGKLLYKTAIQHYKRVIFVSDMYLPIDAIKAILEKNGYSKYGAIYLSNTIGLVKQTGNLFSHIIEVEKTKPENIVHIGDNFAADVKRACEKGITAFHVPKPVDLFKGLFPHYYASRQFDKIFLSGDGRCDTQDSVDNFPGLRCMLALAANKIHDNPFQSCREGTDFNADPVVVGYYALGMYCYAVADWLLKRVMSLKGRPGTIHFAARDGFVVQKIYDLISAGIPGAPKSNYLYCSRKSLHLADVKTKTDLFSLHTKFNSTKMAPDDLFMLFSRAIQDNKKNGFPQWLKNKGYEPAACFSSVSDFYEFVATFATEYIDENLLSKGELASKNFLQKHIKKGDVFFDIGYGGRVESALRSLLGFAVDSYYIHGIKGLVFDRSRISGFSNCQFYDYKPVITGCLRECVMMKDAPSTAGYEKKKGSYAPVFEEYEHQDSVMHVLRESALDFAKEYYETFKGFHEQLLFRGHDAALPFEYFLHNAAAGDRKMFSGLVFEDKLGPGDIPILRQWEQDLQRWKRSGAVKEMRCDIPFCVIDSIYHYLERIKNERYSALIAVKDEAAASLNDAIDTRLYLLGLRRSLRGQTQRSYAAVIDRGKAAYEELALDTLTALSHRGILESGAEYEVASAGLEAGDRCSLMIDGVEYAVNLRGLNIVVYDNETGEVADSVAFDTWSKGLEVNRKN